jgi:hypothetical protein
VRGRLRKLGHGSGELRTLMPIAAEEGKKQQSKARGGVSALWGKPLLLRSTSQR